MVMSFQLDIFLLEMEFRRKAQLCGLLWKNGLRLQQKSCQEELLESCMWKDQQFRAVGLCPGAQGCCSLFLASGCEGLPLYGAARKSCQLGKTA